MSTGNRGSAFNMSGGTGGRRQLPNSLGTAAQRIAEEEPEMRSVALASPRADPFGTSAMASRPPVGVTSLRRSGYGGLPSKPQPSLRRPAPPAAKKASCSSRVGGTWRVTAVEQLPDDFPLERTSKHIHDADAPLISARISDCLRNRSVEAKYDDLKATAKCRSQEYVSFKIRLFGGRVDVEGGGIIVEVQRRKGSCHSFMNECRAVLSAAEGTEPDAEEGEFIFLKRPVSEMACLQGAKVDGNLDETFSTLTQPTELLQQDKHDANMLGMEMIEKLTNPLHTPPEVVVLAAKTVILPENNDEIQARVSSLLTHGTVRPDQEGFKGPEGENEFNEQMHNLALSAVRNAVRATAEDGTLSEAINQQGHWFAEVLIPVLIEDVKAAKDQGNDAVIAVECLMALARCSPTAKEMILDAGALDVLVQSQDFAQGCNASLAAVVGEALGRLRQ